MNGEKEMFDRIISKQIGDKPQIYEKSYIRDLYDRYSHEYSFKLFQIIENKLYVKSNNFPKFEGRFEGVKAHILKLLHKYKLPDMEFVYFDGDGINTNDIILQSASCRESRLNLNQGVCQESCRSASHTCQESICKVQRVLPDQQVLQVQHHLKRLQS